MNNIAVKFDHSIYIATDSIRIQQYDSDITHKDDNGKEVTSLAPVYELAIDGTPIMSTRVKNAVYDLFEGICNGLENGKSYIDLNSWVSERE